jgi:hypothetical protein
MINTPSIAALIRDNKSSVSVLTFKPVPSTEFSVDACVAREV